MMANRHYRRRRSGLNQDHSRVDQDILDFGQYRVKIVPIGRTNYSYFIQDTATGELAVVDPGDAPELARVAKAFFDLPISVVLLTHKHWDHSAGILALSRQYAGLKVYCSEAEPAFDITHTLRHKDVLSLGGLTIQALATPVHTKGSMSFYVRSDVHSLFTGDTFFLGGMGAYFEGDLRTAAQSIRRLLELPDATFMFPGHEYAETTLKFALYVQPNNMHLKRKASWVLLRRIRHLTTVPTTLREEKAYNPFVRIFDQDFYEALGTKHYLGALARLQEMKNGHRSQYRRIELQLAYD